MSSSKTDLPVIREMPGFTPRVETGPIVFGDDWPGVFIRGDNALLGFVPALERMLARPDISLGGLDRAELVGLMRLLQSCSLVKP